MKKMLTVGITTHGNKVSDKIIKCLCCDAIDVIISEDKENLLTEQPEFISKIKSTGTNVRYIFSNKSGIANNRQNILDNVNTKYVYIIDNDDELICDFKRLNCFLYLTNFDILYINCYEDGRRMKIGNKKEFIYMCTWMQIFKTDWLRKLGGYLQSWNFIHEEAATNINLITNLNKRFYKKIVLPKNIIEYYYHANNVCNLEFDVQEVCNFVRAIPFNEKIKNKLAYLNYLENFTRKYMPIYRCLDSNNIYIQNYKNGVYTDILKCISDVKRIVQ